MTDYNLPKKKYNIIYADPPWSVGATSYIGSHGRISISKDFYKVLPDVEIACLDIREITDDNCALFLWAINSRLHESFHIMKNWGFKYKTVAFVWHKTYQTFPFKTWCGLGNYTRGGAEICLLGIRGSMKRVNNSVFQIQKSPVENHSKKPKWVRDSIVKLYGDLPRIELFAREKTDGWDVWGDQT